MLKIYKTFKKILVFSIILSSFIITSTNMNTSKADLMYLEIIFDANWDKGEMLKPIIPVNEIKELNITVDFTIESDEYIGKGALIRYLAGYSDKLLEIYVSIVDMSPWCSASLEMNKFATPLAIEGSRNIKLYLIIDQDAPSFTDGFIKINTSFKGLGFIQGTVNEFILSFTPGFEPKIDTNLPKLNTIEVSPNNKAIFPIELENIGNARTTVLFEIKNIPKNWMATITNEIVLDEATGSKNTAYLTVIPPNNFGYHMDEANIQVIMTPVRAEDNTDVGSPLYASFIIKNRGFSNNGIEQFIFYVIIILIILSISILFLKSFRKNKH